MRHLTTVLTAAVLALAAAPASAAPSITVRDLGVAGYPLVGDGHHVAVTQLASGMARAVDLVTEGERLVAPPSTGCVLTGMAGTAMLWSCAGPRPFATGFVTDLASGQAVQLAGLENFEDDALRFDAYSGGYDGIGRSWLRMQFSGYHWSRRRYVSRPSGALRDPDPPLTPTTDLDLDAPALVTRLCDGIRRPMVLNPAFPIDVIPGPLVRRGRTALALSDATLTLQRCGRRPRRLARCRPEVCISPVLSADVAAWISGSVVSVYDLHTHRTHHRAFGGRVTQLLVVGRQLVAAIDDRLLLVHA